MKRRGYSNRNALSALDCIDFHVFLSLLTAGAPARARGRATG